MIPPQPENILISSAAVAAHKSFAYIVCGALFLHVGAVFKHHVLEGDETLIRMLKTNFVTYKPLNMDAKQKKPVQQKLQTRKPKVTAQAAQILKRAATKNVTTHTPSCQIPGLLPQHDMSDTL